MPSFVFRNPRPARSAVKESPKRVAKVFKATLERIPSRLGWVIIRVPFDVSKVWGTRGKVRVKGEINGFAFRSSVFPTREGYHCMLVKRSMQTGANAALGQTVQFRLEPDTAKRVAIVPAELQRILNEDRSFRRWFDQLAFSMRKWICDWIVNVKNPASRVRRAEQVADDVHAAEEEVELEPLAIEPEAQAEPEVEAEPEPAPASQVKPIWQQPISIPPVEAKQAEPEEVAP